MLDATDLRAAISINGGTPAGYDVITLLRQLVTVYGGTPTQYTIIGLLRQAIAALGGTATQWTDRELIRELLAALGLVTSAMIPRELSRLLGTLAGRPSTQDELGNRVVDELGNRIVGQNESRPLTLKAAAARHGLKLGIAYKSDNAADTTPLRNLAIAEAAMLVPETAAQATVWGSITGVYTFTRLAAHVAIAVANNLPWKVPSGFIYPAHDMVDVSYVDGGGVIQPVLDGSSNPALNSSNVYTVIDALVAAFKAFCVAQNSYPSQINASNELTDPTQGDGWRRHPWYTATSGSAWLVYLIKALKVAFPGIPIGLCQDLMEQPFTTGYGTSLRMAFIAHLDELIAAGAKPDYVDFQSHLRDDRGFDPVALRTDLAAIQTKGIKIIIGELDFRVATTANYTASGYVQAQSYFISQYLDVIMPFLDGGAFTLWDVSDLVQGWGAGQLPCIYDASLVVKPSYYAAIRENLNWR